MRSYATFAALVALPLAALAAPPEKEFIFTSAPFASCHASTLVELRTGGLLAAWFGGREEGAPDVAIWAARRTGAAWSAPFELVREPHVPTWNPVLFYTSDGRLWLYYKFGPSPQTWAAGRRWSGDDGKTWSAPEHLPAGLYGPIRAKPLVMDDGTIVSGTSVESYRTWAAWIERSTDNGNTWTRIGPITVPRRAGAQMAISGATGAGDGDQTYGIIQPSVVSRGGRHLCFYARSTALIGKVCVADSSDAGVTWTEARPLDLPNPNSGIDALALRDRRVVLAFNNSSSARTPLNLAVSQDGEHFRVFRTLEDQPGEYSYPALIQGRDGDLRITYTWNRKRICYVRVPLANVPR
ncbi:MAG TPA: sialidase family protein [Terriglobia bacterium]|nr:sialidase family protein [Terriglobia bacterium]